MKLMLLLPHLDGYEKSLISHLSLKPRKFGKVGSCTCVYGRTSWKFPWGVLLVVFESRPDAQVQIASLAIRSGNGLLLKGEKEAKTIKCCFAQAIPNNVGEGLIGPVTSRDEIHDMLELDDVIDLVIPRGSNKLVSQIKQSTKNSCSRSCWGMQIPAEMEEAQAIQ